MKVFRVGGSVRDELLGLPVHDADWVVVGATPEQMLKRGFQAVGKDFPVFLHPDTHEEYALARTERKTGPGYKGFAVHFEPDVSLEEDLLRRDLTINAIALDEDGSLIDPYDGQTDLTAKLLRHVSPAFAEDPVRILRVARFAARFNEFSVAAETSELMRDMVAAGEVDALVPERVWQEIARGLMSAAPMRMLQILYDCGAAARLLPGVELTGPVAGQLHDALTYANEHEQSLPSRFAVLALAVRVDESSAQAAGAQGVLQATEHLCRSLKVPVDCRDVALNTVRFGHAIEQAHKASALDLLTLVESVDGLRRAERLTQVLDTVLAWSEGRAQAATERMRVARQAARQVDAGNIAKPLIKQGSEAIGQAVSQARVAAIEAALQAQSR